MSATVPYVRFSSAASHTFVFAFPISVNLNVYIVGVILKFVSAEAGLSSLKERKRGSKTKNDDGKKSNITL
jgi:hypothetical protein